MCIQRKAYFRFALCALLLSACGPVTPVPPAGPTALPEAPPAATLEIDGVTQTAGIGSYCWSNGEPTAPSVCVDVAGVPTAAQALVTARTPYLAHFHLPLGTPPDSLNVAVIPAFTEIGRGANGTRYWNPNGGWSGELPLKNEVYYNFQEGPGLYVLQLEAHWKDFGQVSYGFLVQIGETPGVVQLAGTAVPTSGPLVLQRPAPLMRVGKGQVNELALSADGNRLAVGTFLGLYMFETGTQRQLWFRAFSSQPHHLAFSPDGARLAVGLTGDQMPVVDTRSGETLLTVQGEAGLHAVWSPDGKSLLTSGECEEVLVRDALSGQATHTIQPAKCSDVVPGGVDALWSGDGRRIYVDRGNGTVLAWDATTYRPLQGYNPVPAENAFGFGMAVSPTQSLFAILNGLSVDLMDGETGGLVRELAGPAASVPLRDLAWSRDGKRLAAAGDNVLTIWDVSNGRITSTVAGYQALAGLAWMPDDVTLEGVLSAEGSIAAVDPGSGKTSFALDGFDSWNAAGWDGDKLLTYNGASETRWDPATGQSLERHAGPQPGWVTAAAAVHSPNELTDLAKATGNAGTRQKLLDLQDALMDENVAWSPDGSRLAADQPYDNEPPVIWNTQSGEKALSLHFDSGARQLVLTTLGWSPDGRRVTGAGSLMSGPADDGFVAVWDARTGLQPTLLTAGMLSERIEQIAWSPDGHWLAAGADSGKIFLWDMHTGTPVAVLSGHTGLILGLSWSADSRLLASSAGDGTVLVWGMP